MILSDVTIREELAAGRIIIDPLDDDARAAVVGRPPRRPLLPRLPQRHHALHRPEAAQEDLTELVEVERRTARSSSTPASSSSAPRSSGSPCPTISSRGSRAKSAWPARLLITRTAGFVDAGWDGHLTLELSNVANLPIALYPGMKIGQISFLRMTTAAEHPYGSQTTGSKYQGQRGPTPSRYYLNFRDDGVAAPRCAVTL